MRGKRPQYISLSYGQMDYAISFAIAKEEAEFKDHIMEVFSDDWQREWGNRRNAATAP